MTGDSLGCVKFWDPLTNTQLHTFQAHEADVLCLTIGPVSTSPFRSISLADHALIVMSIGFPIRIRFWSGSTSV